MNYYQVEFKNPDDFLKTLTESDFIKNLLIKRHAWFVGFFVCREHKSSRGS